MKIDRSSHSPVALAQQIKSSFLLSLSFFPGLLFAQDGLSNDTTIIVLGLLVLTLMIVLFVIFIVADKLLKVTVQTLVPDNDHAKEVSLLPSLNELLPKSTNYEYVGNDRYIKIKRGFDIKIKGRAVKKLNTTFTSNTYAIKPQNFVGMIPIPKLQVEIGDEVKAGDPLFYDKFRPNIMYTAPVSGEIVEIKRAEKRSISEVVILADKIVKYKEFRVEDHHKLTGKELINLMMESGVWPAIRQRPYNVVADPDDEPKAIFISTFDSSPLGPNYGFTLQGENKTFQAGIDALNKLTGGGVFLGLDSRQKPGDVFLKAENVQRYWFDGPHPSGTVGVHIHHISPINKGEVVWHIGPQEVVVLGRLLLTGKYDTQKIISLAGPEVKEPQYYQTYQGACIENLVKENVTSGNARYISGNVLTGDKIEEKGHIGFFDNLVSVIEEGDRYEMFGWILPSYARPSISPTFPWSLFPDEEFEVNTNTHGEERAFVMTGQYEKVLPMNIYPVHLIKAIMARDFEQMEGLGIYEVDEEDLALCEFVCTSKVDVQNILREGLDYMREQS